MLVTLVILLVDATLKRLVVECYYYYVGIGWVRSKEVVRLGVKKKLRVG